MDEQAKVPSYDPAALLAQASEWRQVAATATDPARRGTYEQLAAECERRVQASIMLPVLSEGDARDSRFVSVRAASELRRTLARSATQAPPGQARRK